MGCEDVGGAGKVLHRVAKRLVGGDLLGAAATGDTAQQDLADLGDDVIVSLGKPVTNASIADHYGDLIDHLVIDAGDAADGGDLQARGLCVTVTPTVMCDAEDRERLARVALTAARIETG